MNEDTKEKLYYRVGCLLPMIIFIGYILFGLNTSSEEIINLVINKKEKWISESLYNLYDDLTMEFLPIEGVGPYEMYNTEIKVLLNFKKYIINFCEKNYMVTVNIKEYFIEKKREIYLSKYDQKKDCDDRLNFETNKFILSQLNNQREFIELDIKINNETMEMDKDFLNNEIDPLIRKTFIDSYNQAFKENRLFKILLNKVNNTIKNYENYHF